MIKTFIDLLLGIFGGNKGGKTVINLPKVEVEEEPKPEPKPFEVIDYTGDQLAKNPNKNWGKRKVSDIKWAVVHQAASTGSMEAIARYHSTPGPENHLSASGAPGIAYHYVIEKDGSVYQVNPDNYLTWHVAKKNTWSLGILVTGDFDADGHDGEEDGPTDAQKESLPKLLDYIKNKYPEIEVVGHCEIAAASNPKPYCPGTILMEEVVNYRS